MYRFIKVSHTEKTQFRGKRCEISFCNNFQNMHCILRVSESTDYGLSIKICNALCKKIKISLGFNVRNEKNCKHWTLSQKNIKKLDECKMFYQGPKRELFANFLAPNTNISETYPF